MATDPIEREVRNLVRLERQSNQLGRLARAELRATLLPEIAASIARHDPTSVTARYQAGRVAKLLVELEIVTASSYASIRRMLIRELAILGVVQGKWAAGLIESAGARASSPVTVRTIRAILRDEFIYGLTLREWIASAEAAFVRTATQVIRNEVERGAAAETIRRSVFGPVMRTARRNLDMIARTAVTFTSNRAHMTTYDANADVLRGVEFLATLDSRTTLICARWDGTVWPVGDPGIQRPPLHPNCRSQIVPVVDWAALGIPAPTQGTRASETGQTTAATYEAWFRRQSPSKQDAIIGPARAKMFRRGELTFRDMVTRDNRVVPVSELAA